MGARLVPLWRTEGKLGTKFARKTKLIQWTGRKLNYRIGMQVVAVQLATTCNLHHSNCVSTPTWPVRNDCASKLFVARHFVMSQANGLEIYRSIIAEHCWLTSQRHANSIIIINFWTCSSSWWLYARPYDNLNHLRACYRKQSKTGTSNNLRWLRIVWSISQMTKYHIIDQRGFDA